MVADNTHHLFDRAMDLYNTPHSEILEKKAKKSILTRGKGAPFTPITPIPYSGAPLTAYNTNHSKNRAKKSYNTHHLKNCWVLYSPPVL